MKKVAAFSPSHITGIFMVKDNCKNPRLRGSLGAGVSLKKGVYTTVEVEKNHKWTVKTYVNGKLVSGREAAVSLATLKEFFKLASPHKILVNHEIGVPISSGYGVSGACALSLSLALNEALNSGLSKVEAAQIAHIAEIKCKTGLGTVLAESFGGVEIRVKAGAPGVGSVKRIENTENFKVVSLCFGKLPTKKFLINKKFRKKVNIIGGRLLKRVIEKPSVDNLMFVSRKFADKLSLYTPKLRKILDLLGFQDSRPFTMNMFGEAVFTLIEEEKLNRLIKTIQAYQNFGGQLIVSEIDMLGARLIE